MTTKNDQNLADLLAEEGDAVEADPNAPITTSTVTRGNGRSKTLQIRLNPEELEELERIAAARGLPTPTVAREAILRLTRPAEARSAVAAELVDGFSRYRDTVQTVIAVSSDDRLAQFKPDISAPSPLGVVVELRRVMEEQIAKLNTFIHGYRGNIGALAPDEVVAGKVDIAPGPEGHGAKRAEK
ncbi:hypothetical protein [Mycolicibacterium xanthum]|uniref:hypothetical protein n=1 Tax=Mycolicibacterium xanthum TaxID=2796469 RepID=UPI002102E183|nr:hypothetical protein [Mycolicibacterium xanthum]